MTDTELTVTGRPTSGEAPFDLGEVFFTRTDARGVIKAFNNVFQRVSHFDPAELQDAPHNIVRHPGMPAGLYHLIWETIKRGDALAAYVKNQAKDGLYYWVFAVMAPCEDGYLSARIKPSAGILPKIEQIYADLRSRETEKGLSPKDSAAALSEAVQALGFADYTRFIADALGKEVASREAKLERLDDGRIRQFQKMQEAADQLTVQTDLLAKEFKMTEIIPHNMRVIASRLEPNGGPISTLSTNYGGMSREMSSWFEDHVVGEKSNFSTIRGTVAQCMFLCCIAKVLHECADQLDAERRDSPGDSGEALEEQRGDLARLAADYADKSEAGQNQVAEETFRILDACKTMNRHMLGLSTTRVMCKIEGARLLTGRESLTDIIGELNGFQERIRDNLKTIEDLSGTIRTLLA